MQIGKGPKDINEKKKSREDPNCTKKDGSLT